MQFPAVEDELNEAREDEDDAGRNSDSRRGAS